MNFDRGGQNLLAQRRRALFISQGLQEEFDCLADIDKCLLDRLALRLAPLQFWAPRVAALLVLFDYDANLARHQPTFYRHRPPTGMFGRSRAGRWTRPSPALPHPVDVVAIHLFAPDGKRQVAETSRVKS